MAYTTVAAVKTYLGISASTDDALLADIVARAQAAVDAYTGRTFEAAADTTKYFDPTRDVDGCTLRFGNHDCCGLTMVVNGDSATIAAASYVTEPRGATPYWGICLKASAGYAWTYVTDPENAIAITGRWGYSITPPADVQQACVLWTAQMYRAKDAQTIEAAFAEQGIVTVQPGVPKAVVALLRHYRRVL